MLNLYEELFLLCLHQEKVSLMPSSSAGLSIGFYGAVLADLALAGRIEFAEKKRLQLSSQEPTQDDLLDEAMSRIQEAKPAKKVAYWMEEFEFKPKKITQTILRKLVDKGVLKLEDEEYSWVIPYPSGSEFRASAKFTLKHRLRTVALAGEEALPHEEALLGLVKACGLLDLVFVKDERKLASQHIYELSISSALKNSAAQILQEIEAAIDQRIEAV